MDDNINRQAVELRINEFLTNETYTEEMLRDEIHNLPSVDVPHWIQCSERLPDRYGKTLVTCGSGVWALVMIAVYSNLMGISKPCFWIGNVGKDDFKNITDQVTAWMPLPESYRG